MSTGIPRDPVCSNDSTQVISAPAVVKGVTFVGDPRVSVITPPTADQTVSPPSP